MLVSVIVVTYNSSKFVTETLDSIANQDYKEIELIISDDCSKDNTLEICKNWIDTNKSRFIDAKVIQTPVNSGICGNYNFAMQYVKGTVIKYIAGDDVLYHNCITSFVNAYREGKHKIFFSSLRPFYMDGKKIVKCQTRGTGKEVFAGNSATEQLHKLFEVIYHATEGPTFFVETEAYKRLGGMDLKYPMLEDFPIALKFLYNGYTVGYIDEPLVLYREYPESVSKSNPKFASMFLESLYDYRIKVAKREHNYMLLWHWELLRMMVKLDRNQRSFLKQIAKPLFVTDIYALINKFKS